MYLPQTVEDAKMREFWTSIFVTGLEEALKLSRVQLCSLL